MSQRITADELDDVVTAAVGAACFACNKALKDAAFTIRELESDASLGALVRRIEKHPAKRVHFVLYVYPCDGQPAMNWRIDEQGLRGLCAHLDSLLPKEPEWTDAPSGRQFRMGGGNLLCRWAGSKSEGCGVEHVVVEDAPVVARLLASQGEGRGDG